MIPSCFTLDWAGWTSCNPQDEEADRIERVTKTGRVVRVSRYRRVPHFGIYSPGDKDMLEFRKTERNAQTEADAYAERNGGWAK